VAGVVTQLNTPQYEIASIELLEKHSDNPEIRALDARFDPIILQLEVGDSVRDFDKLVMHMTEFERRLGAKDPGKEAALSANAAADKGEGKKKGFKGKYSSCEKQGHR
jgi:hypothetical protein